MYVTWIDVRIEVEEDYVTCHIKETKKEKKYR